MAEKGTAAPADLRVGHGDGSTTLSEGSSNINANQAPHSLRDALRSAAAADGGSATTPTDSASEEDYDDQFGKPVAVVMRTEKEPSKGSRLPDPLLGSGSALKMAIRSNEPATPSDVSSETGQLEGLSIPRGTKLYAVAPDDKELREILKRGMQRAKAKQTELSTTKRKGRFRDYVFTKKFSTFDMRNEATATSPFHGFFTLFWLAVGIFMLKIGAENWKSTGSPLGTNDIMKNMFRREVFVLLASDAIMCGITGVSWCLQLLVYKGYIDWDGAGWILQNIWQTLFVFGNIGWTHFRDWPWSHTVFFVLHTLIMLMKQHSYAFYNGYLSTAYKKRQELLKKLKQLERLEAVKPSPSSISTTSAVAPEYLSRRPSVNEVRQRRRSLHSGNDTFSTDLEKIEATLESKKALDMEQIGVFRKIIQWEIDGLTEEVIGKATSADRAYPKNLTMKSHYEYIVLPTVVYELEYPRNNSIDWRYVFEKATAIVGIIFVMIMVSQASIYPVVLKTVAMREADMPLAERFAEFPWLLSDLIFPMLMEYLLSWYVIWEAILNLLGEVTYFADREFYSDWWNSVSWDQFARDWNRPVHNFLLRHVYHSSISAMKVNKHTATLITFFLSALVHELVMWCIFKKLRGYLLVLQMFQIPLVRLSRTKWLKGKKTLGNIFFWVGIFTGPSILCSLYLVL